VVYYAISLLFEETKDKQDMTDFLFDDNNFIIRNIAGTRFLLGEVKITSRITLETWYKAFFAIDLPDHTLRVYTSGDPQKENFEETKNRLNTLNSDDLLKGIDFIKEPLFGEKYFTVKDLFIDKSLVSLFRRGSN